MIRPVSDCIIVKLEPTDAVSSVLVAPTDDSNQLHTGTVVGFGPGRHTLAHADAKKTRFVPTSVKVGERVTFLKVLTKVGGALQDTIAYHVGDDHVLIRETDILFVQDEPVRVSM